MALVSDQLIAHNRFGYGLAPNEEPARDPRGWLLDQLASFEPRPALLRERTAASHMAEFRQMADGGREERREF